MVKIIRNAYSGDIGRYARNQTQVAPLPFLRPTDLNYNESTYGRPLPLYSILPKFSLRANRRNRLKKKGKLIIPAFSVGRTQDLLFALNGMELDGRLPAVRYYVDSPLSTAATKVVKQHPECFNRAVQKLLKIDSDPFDFKALHYIQT
jgi:metallo-beta-lactamase family protein